MCDTKDESIDLMARALSALFWAVPGKSVRAAIEENVRPRVGKHSGEDWSRVEAFLREASNTPNSVSGIRMLAMDMALLDERQAWHDAHSTEGGARTIEEAAR